MRVLILGAGATGGYFGGRLIEAGADVTFLVRAGRAAQLANQGLVIESQFGNIKRPVPTITDPRSGQSYDLLVLSCKAYDLEGAVAAARPAVGPSTSILPLLNGMRHFSYLDEQFGAERVIGGLCAIAATVTPDGSIKHMNDFHVVTVGARRPQQQETVQRISAVFRPANFTFKLSDNIEGELWKKYAFLTTLAGMTCLMRGSVGDIAATRFGKSLVRELLSVTAAVAEKSGHPLGQAWFDDTLSLLTRDGSSFTASMLRDMERGGRLESDHIVGDMLRRAEAHGIAHEILKAILTHLQTYEHRRDHSGRQ